MKNPYLTQKVPGKIRDIVIGQQFIIALREDMTLVSWGEDKKGALGLGSENTTSNEPKEIVFPEKEDSKVVDIQHGKGHVMALSKSGRVYTWGENASGQLGHGNLHPHYEPTCVDALANMTVVQIIAVDNMSYALTNHGVVYAWGDNAEGALGLEHDQNKVNKPEPMMRLKDSTVKRLMIKEVGGHHKSGKTVIGMVGMADDLQFKDKPGGFDRELKTPPPKKQNDKKNATATESATSPEEEKEIFESVNLMRKVMENTLDWWRHLLAIRHGSPYGEEDDDRDLPFESAANNPDEERCTTLQLDTHVHLETLTKAANEIGNVIRSAKEQLREIKKRDKGTKDMRFLLSLFIDDCRLRVEKIQSTLLARELKSFKTEVSKFVNRPPTDDSEVLKEGSEYLERVHRRLKGLEPKTIFTKSFRESLMETIECKLQLYEIAKPRPASAHNMIPFDQIRQRWEDLKACSVYQLYEQEYKNKKPKEVTFKSDEDLLDHLTKKSNDKIQDIISICNDVHPTRDPLVPSICYELLVDNAELRKMCSTYQLRVLQLMQKGLRHPTVERSLAA